MSTTGRDLTQQLAEAQRGIARQFLGDAAVDLNSATDAAHAAFREAVESDGSPESMLRVAEAAQAAATVLSGVARDAAAQATVVHSTPLREAARSIGVSPGAVNRWLEGEGRGGAEWDNTHWWVNEKGLMAEEPAGPEAEEPAGPEAGDVTGLVGDEAVGEVPAGPDGDVGAGE